MKNQKLYIILAIVLAVVIGIFVLLDQKKVTSIVIDINNTKSYNIKLSMAPSYKTVINGTSDSIVNLNVSILPEKKLNKKVKWITSDECAKIDKDNNLIVTGECNFEVYAKSGSVKSNVLEFRFAGNVE